MKNHKFLTLIAALLMGFCAVSCNKSSDSTTPEEESSDSYVKIEIKLKEQSIWSNTGWYITESHSNLYPIYQKLKKMEESLNAKYGARKPLTSSDDDAAREAAKAYCESQIPQIKAEINAQKAALTAELEAAKQKATDFEKATAYIDCAFTIDGIFHYRVFDETVAEDADKELNFIKYNEDMVSIQAQIRIDTLLNGTFESAKAPNFYNAYRKAAYLTQKTLVTELKALNEYGENNCQYFCVSNGADIDKVNANVEKFMEKRLAYAKNTFQAKMKQTAQAHFKTTNVPKEELDYIKSQKFTVSYFLVLSMPYQLCPKCSTMVASIGRAICTGCGNSVYEYFPNKLIADKVVVDFTE